MKIAIASDNEIKIASHFGRTNGFVVVDLENGRITNQEYRKNDFTGHMRGLEGNNHQPDRHAPILDALKDCDIIVSRGMGRRLISDLKIAGKEIYLTEEEYVARAINLYVDGILDNNTVLGCDHN